MKLDELRRRIDEIDDRILDLLKERAVVAEDVAAVKRIANIAVFHDPEREREVLDRLENKGAGSFPRASIRAVFREIMSGCLSLEQPVRIAYLGPEGTYSHIAARQSFGTAALYREATSIEGVFDAVLRGDAIYGVVPIENVTEGSVAQTLDALLQSDLRIRQELVLDIAHCLLSRASKLTGIERVYSHPQALAQCRGWLSKYLGFAQTIPTASTAAAAREALADRAAAAIASRLAGEIHGLPVLRDAIQDRAKNATRFVVIAREDAPRTGNDKTSLAFSTPDETGALRRALSLFEGANINLSRIESRPAGEQPWQYVFYVDAEGHREDEKLARAISQLEAQCPLVRVLGSYPRAVLRDKAAASSDEAKPPRAEGLPGT